MDQLWLNPAHEIDRTFVITFGIQVILLLGITLTTIYFLFRYHHTRHPHPDPIEGNVALEVIWIVIPLMLCLGMFRSGWVGFDAARNAPPDALSVKVTGRMWVWNFEYPNGKRSKTMVVPLKKPVLAVINSVDVLHSFYIPAYRIKIDAVPGRETSTWYYPDTIGTFTIFCSEYCGLRHSQMLSQVQVVTPEAFETWYNTPSATDTLELSVGAKLLDRKGCLRCHSLDGSQLVGPSLLGVWGRESTIVDYPDKRVLIADEEYITRSILEPSREIVEGYENVMPQLDVSPEELKEILGYLKSLK